MEVDFSNLTDEAKDYLKKHMDDVETATGVIAFDPTKPIGRSAMEQLKIEPTVDGKKVPMSVWEASQKASLAASTAHEKREAAEAKKVVTHLNQFRELTEKGEMPSQEVLDTVASAIGVSRENLVAGLTGEGGGNGDGQAGAKKTNDSNGEAGATMDEKALQALIDKRVEEKYGKRLLPSEFHAQFVNEGMTKHADELLKAEVDKALKSNPEIVKLVKEAGDDKQKQEVITRFQNMYTRTVDKAARGRIAQIARDGTGDITEEIPDIVKDIVDATDPTSILQLVAPQPIHFGAGGPGESDLTILSKEKPEPVPYGHPDYEKHLMQEVGMALAESQEGST
jgi:hypothetical protein